MMEHYYSRQPSSPVRLGLIRCSLRGVEFEFVTSSGVFSRRRVDPGTRLLIESMELPERGEALDVGCGYGPIGIAAAKFRPSLGVWMVDVNERAVTLARENVRRNGVENVRILQGHLYKPFRGRAFDVILSNPPFSAGFRKVIEPLVGGARRHLRAGGSIQLVVRSSKGGKALAALLERYYGSYEVLARGGGYRVLKASVIS
jgi:16S rRNA (guanine1207-N2)-methyltransferase